MKNKNLFKKVRLVVMDFDGVHTDGFVYVNDKGEETVRCSRRDGLGIEMLKKIGVKSVVVSKEKNKVVLQRCKKLGIESFYGVADSDGKKNLLIKIMEREGLRQGEIIFIGDDINDIGALTVAGLAVTVADAHPEVKEVSDIVLTRKGGDHAIRELADLILISQGHKVAF